MKRDEGFIALFDSAEYQPHVGGIVGLLIGDALGVPYEFHPPESLPKHSEISMVPPPWLNRAHPSVQPGTWSDDGSQALCLLASLLEQRRFSLTDFAGKLLRWLDHGYMAVDGDVFDVGIQTAKALGQLRAGVSPYESGGADERSNGNGSLMRVLPLAVWHTGTDEEIVKDAHLQSLPTHAHPRSMVACAYYCLVARAYLNKLADPWTWADERLESLYGRWSDGDEGRLFLTELNVLRQYPETSALSGSGYVLDTLWSARKALEEKSFEDVLRAAILFGNDTDTTAAVAGGLAGIQYGIGGISGDWLMQLRGFELIAPTFHQLLQNDTEVRDCCISSNDK